MLLAQGRGMADAAKAIGLTEQSNYRWRREYGGLKSDQARRLQDFERQNARLRKAVADLTLDQCPTSSPLRQNGGVEERRISGSS